ncbi:hypothetical protein LY78DRAFT_152630 [Colletotrichum sublineola]|nr:hypothetical protein LY78DRAFT_152630 [Colletotrichum sublineola]
MLQLVSRLLPIETGRLDSLTRLAHYQLHQQVRHEVRFVLPRAPRKRSNPGGQESRGRYASSTVMGTNTVVFPQAEQTTNRSVRVLSSRGIGRRRNARCGPIIPAAAGMPDSGADSKSKFFLTDWGGGGGGKPSAPRLRVTLVKIVKSFCPLFPPL